MKKTGSSGCHFEIQYGAGYQGNLDEYLALNYSTLSKVPTFKTSF